MANYDWTGIREKYNSAIVKVATQNGADMGVGLDMLISMVWEPDQERRDMAVSNYGPIPEDLDQEVFRADVAAVQGR